jgi:tetratricopeptide (TPR) repeat protein
MERVEKTVFLSYRRTNIPWALAIFQNLTQHGYDVFFDFTGLARGDFERVIIGNIRARAHFIVLLTPSALERCDDPNDWLRREIEAALDSQRNMVPLMLEGFDFGSPTIARQLTGRLAAVKHYNALSIPPEYFLEAMVRLRDRHLNVALDAVLHPASLSAQRAATEQKAAAKIAPAVQEEELTAQQWFERGLNAGDLDEEVRCYSMAIRLKPDFADAFNNRGEARRESGDLDGAISDYSQAIRLKSDYATAFNNRGVVRRAKGDVEGALQDYNEAIRRDSKYAPALVNRGVVRCDEGDLDHGLEDFEEAIRLRPHDAVAFNNRGIVRFKRGDLEGALQDYNESIRLKPDYPLPFSNRGLVRRANGDLEGALQDYDAAIRIKPSNGQAFYNRSLARREKGYVKGAQDDYNEAIRLGYKP